MGLAQALLAAQAGSSMKLRAGFRQKVRPLLRNALKPHREDRDGAATCRPNPI